MDIFDSLALQLQCVNEAGQAIVFVPNIILPPATEFLPRQRRLFQFPDFFQGFGPQHLRIRYFLATFSLKIIFFSVSCLVLVNLVALGEIRMEEIEHVVGACLHGFAQAPDIYREFRVRVWGLIRPVGQL